MNKIIKGAALFIPTIICCILLILVTLKVPETTTAMEVMEIRMDSLLGIIGVAVSVWIGLNIYNIVERNEIDNTYKRLEETEKKLEELEKKIEEASNQVARFG